VSGTLYVVATPIGNLEDITYRAVATLQASDLIACEDTRHTRRLLDHYGVAKPLVSYHEHNERERTGEFLERLAAGQSISLVSDAGTPLISDPGYRLVSAAVAAGLKVVAIPGPSAILTALAASGLATDSFYFGGFLPAKSGQRRKTLERASGLDCVVVFYEAPHRLIETLEDVAAVFHERAIVVARELTKLHEEFARGTAAEVLGAFRVREAIKGEITLLIDKPPGREATPDLIREVFDRLTSDGMSRMDAMKATARECGVSKREVYSEIETRER
jgi:16S rRNA (cytidine1402-2'-O)-methyltransferase